MKREIKDCYCGNKTFHTAKCKRLKRLDRFNEIRYKLRKEHKCVYNNCKKKIKPITTFPQFCEKHRKK